MQLVLQPLLGPIPRADVDVDESSRAPGVLFYFSAPLSGSPYAPRLTRGVRDLIRSVSREQAIAYRQTGNQPERLSRSQLTRLSAHCGKVLFDARLLATHALSRARPLARRALIIARPARVFIRARKPCRRFLLILLG
jgi:hypothetical protein